MKSSNSDYDTEWTDQLQIGDIIITEAGSYVSLPGNYELISQIAGGGLIAYGYSFGNSGDTTISQNQLIRYSDDSVPKSMYSIENYIDGILTFESGTFKVHPSDIVGMVEANFMISGHCSTEGGGVWMKGNANDLPSGVSCSVGNSVTGDGYPLFSFGTANGYGGFSGSFLYQVASNSDSFFVNPSFVPYLCDFTPGGGGVGCGLTVKVYAKKGVYLSVWKKTA